MKHWFIIGTAAELIKLYPIIHESHQAGTEWHILQTGQSSQNFLEQANDFGISKSKIIELVSNKSDLKNSLRALIWFLKALLVRQSEIHSYIAKSTSSPIESHDLVFVHGDTLSTVVGTIYGRRLGLTVVHIEAGMRSHFWKSPFPEELSRRFVSCLANIHMAPDENASNNLMNEGIKHNVHVTCGNTVVDALRLTLTNSSPMQQPYVIANIHRYENLYSPQRWNHIIEILIETSKQHQIILILMPNTIAKFEKDKESFNRLLKAGVFMQPRLPFGKFAKLLHGATFVISDGGSNQQECFYLGKPCLILRDVTESLEGIGQSCVLAKFDNKIITEFLTGYEKYRRPMAFPKRRPTDIIFERLKV
jgi:UDP-N-acetylglucosamine 2-epimerase (non-hydrolysing)